MYDYLVSKTAGITILFGSSRTGKRDLPGDDVRSPSIGISIPEKKENPEFQIFQKEWSFLKSYRDVCPLLADSKTCSLLKNRKTLSSNSPYSISIESSAMAWGSCLV